MVASGGSLGTEAILRHMVDNTEAHLAYLDADLNFVAVNSTYARGAGYAPDELLGKNHFELFPDQENQEIFERVRETGTPVEFRDKPFVYRDQPWRGVTYWDWTLNPVKDAAGIVQGLVLSLLDVTERKRAEETLRRERDLMRRITETSPAGITVVNGQGEITFANTRAQELLGLTRDEIALRGYNAPEWHITDLDGNEFCEADLPFRRVMSTGEPVFDIRHAIECPKRGRILLAINGVPLIDESGQVDGGVFAVEDITDRIRVEEALRKSEERYQELYDSAPDMYFTLAPDGTVLSVNRSGAEQLGYTTDELIGRPVWAVVHEEDLDKVRKHAERLFAEKLPQSELDSRKVRKDGSILWVYARTRLVLDENDRPRELRVVCRDITERKRSEEQSVRSQKLEALGTLAGGIAHDFNNLLTGILGNISLAKLGPKLEPESYELLEEAERASMRAKQLTNQLLTFAKGGAPVKRPLAVANLIKEATHFALRGSNVGCELVIAADLWPANVDEGQLNQAIHNLVINAQQAMPEGGTIRVRAENVPASQVRDIPLKPDKYIAISIEDHGIGIPKGHLQNIFDPYFSTKEKGRGLGLAVTRSIIEKHGGHIEVESTPGVGTTFTIYLPAAEIRRFEGSRAGDAKRAEEKGPQDRKRLLVMDDEEMVGRISRQIMGYLGYSVALARDGVEAVELYKKAIESGEPYDAVILDLTVPGGMGGKEAIKRLLDIDPGVKGIVSSGYSNDPVMANFAAHGFRGVIAKPYEIEDLRDTLQRVITGEDTQS